MWIFQVVCLTFSFQGCYLFISYQLLRRISNCEFTSLLINFSERLIRMTRMRGQLSRLNAKQANWSCTNRFSCTFLIMLSWLWELTVPLLAELLFNLLQIVRSVLWFVTWERVIGEWIYEKHCHFTNQWANVAERHLRQFQELIWR